MGCIKTNEQIKINKIEPINKEEIDQNKVITTYISSSECSSDSEESSKNSSVKKCRKSIPNNMEIESISKNGMSKN